MTVAWTAALNILAFGSERVEDHNCVDNVALKHP
jgi:hypothetical protein